MKHRRVISVIAMVMLLAGLMVTPVVAQPPVPCSFEGTVTLDGAACPGSSVEARVGTTVVGTVTVTTDSMYFMVVAQDADTGVPAEDATLEFYVDGFLGGTSIWESGENKTVNLAALSGAVTRYTLTVNVSPAASGTVSVSPTQPADGYIADTVVTLTATAAADYEFDSWGGDASGTSPTTTVTMDSDKSVTAYFESTVVPPPAETFADWLYNLFIA